MIEIPDGKVTIEQPVGEVDAFVHVYQDEIPYLIDFRTISVTSDRTAYAPFVLLEGSSGGRGLSAFDQDFDLAIDSAELKAGTDINNASSFPGAEAIDWPSPVLSPESGWYRGELQANSSYGSGVESVRELVRRAERSNLDFIAITDRNTLAAAYDPGFKSDSVVLIPGMEWGNDEMGVALIYAPRTLPPTTLSRANLFVAAVRTRAQGGVFAIAHPCFPTAPWQWGMNNVSAVQGWCRGWGRIPPISLEQLTEERLKERLNGKLVHSIATAAATLGRSANGQATLYWDLELKRGLRAGVIAGSRTSHPSVPMAEPVTYIFAKEKSLRGLLNGLIRGRTMVARDLDAPRINFYADILNDGTTNAIVGDLVPLRHPTRFVVEVSGAKGMRLEILLNGLPIRSKRIDSDELTYSIVDTPQTYSVYRARVVEIPTEPILDVLEMVAMTSPIYAREVVIVDEQGRDLTWVEVESDYVEPNTLQNLLPDDPEKYELKPLVIH